MAERVVYVLTVLILAGMTGYQYSWWAAAALILIAIVVLAKPKWGGEDWWPF